MNRRYFRITMLTFAACVILPACGDDRSQATSGSKPLPVAAESTSPGKPSAPISIDYEVLGRPIVGTPVSINVDIRGEEELGPVSVSYSINDTSALVFQEGQVEILEMKSARDQGRQQLAVIPQREGRLYVNVSAEVQTPGGSMIKSIAIPIQVGSAPNAPQANGELRSGPDGETVISLPAEQNR